MTDDKTAPEANLQLLADDKDLPPSDSPDEPTLDIPEGQLSNLWLLILGSAFFALWALNVSTPSSSMPLLIYPRLRLSSRQQ
jgi:hypothetical protein